MLVFRGRKLPQNRPVVDGEWMIKVWTIASAAGMSPVKPRQRSDKVGLARAPAQAKSSKTVMAMVAVAIKQPEDKSGRYM